MGLSECVWRTFFGMVRSMLGDSGLPPFLWGDLMMLASYLCKSDPAFGAQDGNAVYMLHGRDAGPSHFRIIVVGAFIYYKDANSLVHTSWERTVCCFSPGESNSLFIWNPKARRQGRHFHPNTTALASPFQADFATGTGGPNV